MSVKHGNGIIKLQCECGHKMTTKANILNDLNTLSYWRCHKCGKRYELYVKIKELSKK